MVNKVHEKTELFEIKKCGSYKYIVIQPNTRFGRLTVIEERGKNNHGTRMSLCKCDCGRTIIANNGNLIRKRTQSCGCLFKERSYEAKTQHGMSKTPEYGAWHGMITRCTNKNAPQWKSYGGRGIFIEQKEWLGRDGFVTFYKDIGPKPEPKEKYSLDRIDNNKGYYKENCRWATAKEQTLNQRKIGDLDYFTDEQIIQECLRRKIYIEKPKQDPQLTGSLDIQNRLVFGGR